MFKLSKVLFLLSLTLILHSAYSQNWQTLNSNSVKYFQTSHNYIFGTRFDSVEINNGDSVFHSYRVLREESSPFGMNPKGAWFGDKLIIKQNGDNVFINSNSDSITIKTTANVGDNFTMYTYDDGSTVEAIVSSIDTATFYGITDSIKVFDLTFNGSSNFINPKIVIGKKLGLTTTLPFWSFPYHGDDNIVAQSMYSSLEPYELVGQDFPKLGITKPTFANLFTFEIGDIIQFETNSFVSNSIDSFIQLSVLEKTTLPNDSTNYKFLREVQTTDSICN